MSLMTTLEQAPSTTKWKSFDRVTGYFKAPIKGQYQFHQSCDDECKFYMSLSDPMDPAAKELLMYRTYIGDYAFRSYGEHNHNNDPDASDSKVGSVFSEWIDLEADTYYYIETQHREWSGADHFTVGFEVKADDPSDIDDYQPMQSGYYQKLTVDQDITREKAQILI